MQYRGYLALLGRPNVGKSTLFNRLLGRRAAAVTHKPHTTRSNIRGVLETGDDRIILIDTPGLNQGGRHRLNRVLNRNISIALERVHACLLLCECGPWRRDDESMLELIKSAGKPCLLVLNKVDRVRDKTALLDVLRDRDSRHDFHALVPLSARFDQSTGELTREVLRLPMTLGAQDKLDQVGAQGADSGVDERGLVEELVREQIMLGTQNEVPYASHVRVVLCEQRKRVLYCVAHIFAERESQRAILIGRGGRAIKQIGSRARRVLQTVLSKPVHLELQVKVADAWRNDSNIVRSYTSNILS